MAMPSSTLKFSVKKKRKLSKKQKNKGGKVKSIIFLMLAFAGLVSAGSAGLVNVKILEGIETELKGGQADMLCVSDATVEKSCFGSGKAWGVVLKTVTTKQDKSELAILPFVPVMNYREPDLEKFFSAWYTGYTGIWC